MGVRICKALFGALIVMSLLQEYNEYVKQRGHSIIMLGAVGLFSLLGWLLLYSSIQNKTFLSYFKKQKQAK
jgi:hypothetical protein